MKYRSKVRLQVIVALLATVLYLVLGILFVEAARAEEGSFSSDNFIGVCESDIDESAWACITIANSIAASVSMASQRWAVQAIRLFDDSSKFNEAFDAAMKDVVQCPALRGNPQTIVNNFIAWWRESGMARMGNTISYDVSAFVNAECAAELNSLDDALEEARVKVMQ